MAVNIIPIQDPIANAVLGFGQQQQYERRRKEEERAQEREEQKQRAIMAAAIVGGFVVGPAVGLSGGTLGATQIGSTLSSTGAITPIMSAGLGSLEGAAAGAGLAGAFGNKYGAGASQVLGGIAQGVETARQRQSDIQQYGMPVTSEGRMQIELALAKMGGSTKEQREKRMNKLEYLQYLGGQERTRISNMQERSQKNEDDKTKAYIDSVGKEDERFKYKQLQDAKKENLEWAETMLAAWGVGEGSQLTPKDLIDLKQTKSPDELNQILSTAAEQTRMSSARQAQEEAFSRAWGGIEAQRRKVATSNNMQPYMTNSELRQFNEDTMMLDSLNEQFQNGEINYEQFLQAGEPMVKRSRNIGQRMMRQAPPDPFQQAMQQGDTMLQIANRQQQQVVSTLEEKVLSNGSTAVIYTNPGNLDEAPDTRVVVNPPPAPKAQPDLSDPSELAKNLGARGVTEAITKAIDAHMSDDDLEGMPEQQRRQIAAQRALTTVGEQLKATSSVFGGGGQGGATDPQQAAQKAFDLYNNEIGTFDIQSIRRMPAEQLDMVDAKIAQFISLMKQAPPDPTLASMFDQIRAQMAEIDLRRQDLALSQD